MRVIETKYMGVTYRSRLEARWGAFFHHMKFGFIYEPEGFEHDGKTYLPDFWVDEIGGYVAVKPSNCNPCDLIRDLTWQDSMEACGMHHVILRGVPAIDGYYLYVNHIPSQAVKAHMVDCRKCDGVQYVHEDGWGNLTACCESDKPGLVSTSYRLNAAMEYAMKQRFGERK